jgi:ABC-2 type transport system permease protein
MNKIWLVFKYEYTRHVLRKRFLIAVLSMPLFIIVMMAASIAASMMSINRSPVGYINQSDVLKGFSPAPPKEGFLRTQVEFVPCSSEIEADNALQKGTIQAYYILDTSYSNDGSVRLVYLKSPAVSIQDQFEGDIKQFLIKSQPPEIVNRLTDGYHLTLQSLDGTRKMGENDWINIVAINIAGILFIVVLFSSSGYLMSALVEEKENRTMEIMITSVSSDQLMAGKVLGNICVGLTQLVVWVFALCLGYLIGKGQFVWLQSLNISLGTILTLAAVMLPGFVMVAALMAMLGSTVTESREAQQMTGLITLPVVCPFWLETPILMNPNGNLSVGMSFFPLTAPLTMIIRTSISYVPAWQVLLCSGILIICAAGAIWLSARAFRLGMVRYGKKVSLKELFGRQVVRNA